MITEDEIDRDAAQAAGYQPSEAYRLALLQSDVVVRHVVGWLLQRGVSAWPICDVTKIGEADQGDAAYRMDGAVRRLEIKGITRYRFNGRHDWPFTDYIVGQVEAINRTRPAIIMAVNNTLTRAGVVHLQDMNRWTIRAVRQHTQEGRFTAQYVSPLENVLFISLDATQSLQFL